MGTPIVCSACGTKNGLLHDECRNGNCGKTLLPSGKKSKTKVCGDGPPTAFWETDSIPDLWHSAKLLSSKIKPLSMHDFLEYCLLLKRMQEKFDEEDSHRWFDDTLFFLSGGYDFWSHLLTTSELTSRGRIFGGLNHALRPKEKLRMWLSRILKAAISAGGSTIDVFVADEMNSGNGANRFINVINKELRSNPINNKPMSICFVLFLAYTNSAKVKINEFRTTIKRKNRIINNIKVKYKVEFFKSTIIGYDSDIYTGIKRVSSGNARQEKYVINKYIDPTYHIFCPTNKNRYSSPQLGIDPVSHGVGNLELFLLNHQSPDHKHLRDEIRDKGCDRCQELFAKL